MGEDRILEARREARVDALVFIVAALALLVALAVVSLAADWELIGLHGWVWLLLCLPLMTLAVGIALSARMADHRSSHKLLEVLIGFVVAGNGLGLIVLVAGLITEKASDLTGAQLLMSGGVLWFTNIIVFGLWFWTLDDGGPVERAITDRFTRKPDFQFPQDDNHDLARGGGDWYPRLEDYEYVALTNAIAFSPTDTLPLTRWAKALMAAESAISVVAVLLVAARAVNILGS
jgi:small-conductance mechanosensitive channel